MGKIQDGRHLIKVKQYIDNKHRFKMLVCQQRSVFSAPHHGYLLVTTDGEVAELSGPPAAVVS